MVLLLEEHERSCSNCTCRMRRCAGCADGFFSDWLKDFSDYYKYTPPKGGPSPMGSVDVSTCFASVPPTVKTPPAGYPSANLSSINCTC
jgi:hypothetical protein